MPSWKCSIFGPRRCPRRHSRTSKHRGVTTDLHAQGQPRKTKLGLQCRWEEWNPLPLLLIKALAAAVNHSLAHNKELGGHSTAQESSQSAPRHCILLCLPVFPTVKLQADHNTGAAEGLTRVCGPGSHCIPAATGPGAALRDPALALMYSTIGRFQLF